MTTRRIMATSGGFVPGDRYTAPRPGETIRRMLALTGKDRPRHLDPEQPGEFPVPEFGEHDLVPPSNLKVWHPPEMAREGA